MPYRAASHDSPDPSPGAGSMKWFIPPMRATGSARQTAMHEPSTVLRSAGSRVARTPPMWITASCRSSDSGTPTLFPTRSDDLLVDTGSQGPQLRAEPEQRFRAAQKEAAADSQELDEPGDAPLLEVAVEVDEHVPAKDGVQRRPDGTALRQVDAPEGDQLSDLRAHLDHLVRAPGAADEVLRAQRGRDPPHPCAGRAERVQDRERDAVGLLAAGAAGAPDPEPPRRAGPRGRRRQDRGAQDAELALVPEELGLVGRDGVDHADPLVPVRIAVQEMLVVLAERGVPVPSKPLPQPRADELPLVVSKGDAGFPVDERAQTAELLVGDPEVTKGGGDPFGSRGDAGHSFAPVRTLSSRRSDGRPRRSCRAPDPGQAGRRACPRLLPVP